MRNFWIRFFAGMEENMIHKNWQELIRPSGISIKSGDDPKSKATIVTEPLERGFGLTLGNALRRILLSSLQGASIVSVQIDGVLHEFSTIPGVKDDMADIIQNLKSVRFKLSDSDVDNVNTITSSSAEGRALISIQFEQDISERVFKESAQSLRTEIEKVSLPNDAEDPNIIELDSSILESMLDVVISGNVSELKLKQIAEDFICNLAQVLEYYNIGFIRTQPRYEPRANLHNDNLSLIHI